MKENNSTQEIFNNVINIENIDNEELVIPITTEVKATQQTKSIYDSVINTIEQEMEGENENGE